MLLPERINAILVSSFSNETGTLTQPSQFMFQYTQAYPISLTMPFRTAPYNHGVIHPCFTQHLPEGYVRRYICERLNRYAHINDMYLLALQQNKGVGHLSYTSAIQDHTSEQDFSPLSLNELLTYQGTDSLFLGLLDRYYLNGLASGIQPKVLVEANQDIDVPLLNGLSQNRGTVTQGRYIVKTSDSEFPLLTVNEYVCMEAARACGLAPSKCWLSQDLTLFVTERFDRPSDQRIAIEDFTVLLAKSGDQKYQSSYETVMRATQMFTRNDIELKKIYRYIVFNCLIGNGDAHLKNFSIQYDSQVQKISITPPYDITHTLIYDSIDNEMALKMNNTKRFPDRTQLVNLGKAFNIKDCELMISDMADTLVDYLHMSNEVKLFTGLHASILLAVSTAMGSHFKSKPYIHHKRKKYD